MRTFYIKYSTSLFSFFFFLNDPAPPEIYPLPLHDALPISLVGGPPHDDRFAFHRHGQVGVDEPADLALGALHGDPQAVELRGHALGHGDRLPADARHGRPPTRPTRAARRPPGRCALHGRS